MARQTVAQTKAKMRKSISKPIDAFVPGSIQKKQEKEKRKFFNEQGNKNPKKAPVKKKAPKKPAAPKKKGRSLIDKFLNRGKDAGKAADK